MVGHVRTLYNFEENPREDRWLSKGRNDSQTWSLTDLAAFFFGPALVTVILLVNRVALSEAAIGTLVTALSIFGALLFNLLMLNVSLAAGERGRATSTRRITVIRELHNNVSFAVLLAIFCLCDLVPAAIVHQAGLVDIVSPIFYYTGTMLLLTLLMVLKRTHTLIAGELKSG